jgi:hypothetical protein
VSGKKLIDWITLRAEFVAGDWMTLEKFFEGRPIARGTWQTHTRGWVDEREMFLNRINEKMLEKVANDRAKRLARLQKIGEAMQNIGIKSIAGETANVKIETANEAVNMIAKGVEIEQIACQDDKQQDMVGVEINFDGKGINGETIESIRLIAKNESRNRVSKGNVFEPLLGNQ